MSRWCKATMRPSPERRRREEEPDRAEGVGGGLDELHGPGGRDRIASRFRSRGSETVREWKVKA
jgi:hypothetical protein